LVKHFEDAALEYPT